MMTKRCVFLATMLSVFFLPSITGAGHQGGGAGHGGGGGGSSPVNITEVATAFDADQNQNNEYDLTIGGGGSLVAFVKDVKADGVHGGDCGVLVWTTRDLNNLTGNTSFISLASNQFTLEAGTYIVNIVNKGS